MFVPGGEGDIGWLAVQFWLGFELIKKGVMFDPRWETPVLKEI